MARLLPIVFLLLFGCGEGTLSSEPPPTPDPDPSELDPGDALYALDHVLEIEITMDPADAAALAAETNDIFNLLEGADCMDAPWSADFTWFPGDIRVDGVLVPNVGLRKKGLIGSLSTTRPSLKVKFDKYVPDQALHGLERLTLNNSISDPTLVKQCLGYQLFEEAGIAAPRCNFAHVVAQGIDLGIYVNVEPVKRRFLRRAFDDDNGDLYEGTLSDFRPGWTDTFEADTSSTDPERAPIHALTEALQDGSPLDAVLDLEAFHRFWAMEVLIAHWDGYAGNRNNYFVYRPEGDEQLQFVPWGIDGILRGADNGQPTLANSALPRQLWNDPEQRDRQVDMLRELLDAVWDEDKLLDRIDAMAERVAPFAVEDERRLPETEALRDFVLDRRDALLDVLAGPLTPIEQPLGERPCLVEAGELSVEFEATWDTLGSPEPLETGTSRVTGSYHGEPIALDGSALAGLDGDRLLVATLALDQPTTVRQVVAVLPLWTLGPDPIPLGGFGAGAYLFDIDFSTEPSQSTNLGALWNGSLQFTRLEGEEGGVVAGSFAGTLYDGGP